MAAESKFVGAIREVNFALAVLRGYDCGDSCSSASVRIIKVEE